MIKKIKSFQDLKPKTDSQKDAAKFIVESSAQEICEHFEIFLYSKQDWDSKPFENHSLSSRQLFNHLIERLVWLRDREELDLNLELILSIFEKEKYDEVFADKKIPKRIGQNWRWGYDKYSMKSLKEFVLEWSVLAEKQTIEQQVLSLPKPERTPGVKSKNPNKI